VAAARTSHASRASIQADVSLLRRQHLAQAPLGSATW
jgi:hypothetical protein